MYQVAGDAPDPAGVSDARGTMSSVNLTTGAIGRPWVKWSTPMGDLWLEVDVYKLPNEPAYIHLICPQCRNALRITQDQKDIHYEPERPPPFAAELAALKPDVTIGGTLNVAPFECTWGADGSARREFGFARCGWKVAIDKGVARNQ